MHVIVGNLHDRRPSSVSTPKISHVTENGQWESTRRVTTPLTLDLLNQNGKKKYIYIYTTNNENNDGEIKPELIKITIIATTVAIKMRMGKIQSDNSSYDSTNKQRKSWSFRRQYLQNITTSLRNNNARLFVLESNRCPRAKVIFHFFYDDSNALNWNESRFKGGLSPHMECGLIIGVHPVR